MTVHVLLSCKEQYYNVITHNPWFCVGNTNSYYPQADGIARSVPCVTHAGPKHQEDLME